MIFVIFQFDSAFPSRLFHSKKKTSPFFTCFTKLPGWLGQLNKFQFWYLGFSPFQFAGFISVSMPKNDELVIWIIEDLFAMSVLFHAVICWVVFYQKYILLQKSITDYRPLTSDSIPYLSTRKYIFFCSKWVSKFKITAYFCRTVKLFVTEGENTGEYIAYILLVLNILLSPGNWVQWNITLFF